MLARGIVGMLRRLLRSSSAAAEPAARILAAIMPMDMAAALSPDGLGCLTEGM